MRTRHILRNILFFCIFFQNKLYEAIMKRQLQHSMGILKFTAPLSHYTFLYGVNTFGVKNRFLLK